MKFPKCLCPEWWGPLLKSPPEEVSLHLNSWFLHLQPGGKGAGFCRLILLSGLYPITADGAALPFHPFFRVLKLSWSEDIKTIWCPPGLSHSFLHLIPTLSPFMKFFPCRPLLYCQSYRATPGHTQTFSGSAWGSLT